MTSLPFDDTRDFDDVARGFIATLEPNVVRNDQGAVAAGTMLDGDTTVLQQVLAVLDPGDTAFNIIEP